MYGTPKLNTWRGLAFEQLCLSHAEQIQRALGISGVAAALYSWNSAASAPGAPGAQIDLVIDRADGLANLCEIKYSAQEYAITKADAENILHKMRAFERETRTRKSIHVTWISTYGIKQNKYSNLVASEVVLEDLFSY